MQCLTVKKIDSCASMDFSVLPWLKWNRIRKHSVGALLLCRREPPCVKSKPTVWVSLSLTKTKAISWPSGSLSCPKSKEQAIQTNSSLASKELSEAHPRARACSGRVWTPFSRRSPMPHPQPLLTIPTSSKVLCHVTTRAAKAALGTCPASSGHHG